MPDEKPPDSAREFCRRLGGNELKILHAIHFLVEDNADPTADAIATEAGIGRTTVYRLLPRLANDQYIVYHLSDKGKAVVEISLSSLSQTYLEQLNIRNEDGTSTKCLPDPLPAHKPTEPGVPNWDAAQRVKPSQIGTPSHPETTSEREPNPNVKNRTKDAKTLETSWGAAHQRAKEWAMFSHRALESPQDQKPPKHLGYHITVWRHALYLDDLNNGEPRHAHQLQELVKALQDRIERGEGHQGRAWSARTKALTAAWNMEPQNQPRPLR